MKVREELSSISPYEPIHYSTNFQENTQVREAITIIHIQTFSSHCSKSLYVSDMVKLRRMRAAIIHSSDKLLHQNCNNFLAPKNLDNFNDILPLSNNNNASKKP